MFDISSSKIESVVVHIIGNKLKEEDLVLSHEASGMDAPTEQVVWSYVHSGFKTPDFYQFTHPVDLEMNAAFTIARDIFNSPEKFLLKSQQLATLLYEGSQHPQIKSGELFIIYFKDLGFDGLYGDAIGLFKSEKKHPFLFTEEANSIIDLFTYSGINPSKVDKACLIFNESEEDGYKVLSVDNVNKGEETKFWFEDFLKIKSRSTDFAKTSSIMNMAKDFISLDLNTEESLEKPESIDLLNKSINFFKENESFDLDNFSEEVFEDDEVSGKFKSYAKERQKDDLVVSESFNISTPAVKKQTKYFKSILKLDKNFHVYVHGNKEWIEKGVDDNGRKFYKLYYEEES
jgi:hypothetical protein